MLFEAFWNLATAKGVKPIIAAGLLSGFAAIIAIAAVRVGKAL